MVREYIIRKRPAKRAELQHFRRLSLQETVETATVAKNSEGKRSHHHRRRTLAQLLRGKSKLISVLVQIGRCETFDELHNLVCKVTDPIKGLGELYAYDTSCAIGAHLGLGPNKVYLHAGTRRGAQALDFPGNLTYLEASELPAELQLLEPYEMEDFLCIYEPAFRKLGCYRKSQ
jgi:hypothetical protein